MKQTTWIIVRQGPEGLEAVTEPKDRRRIMEFRTYEAAEKSRMKQEDPVLCLVCKLPGIPPVGI